jgi:hypothetical protein
VAARVRSEALDPDLTTEDAYVRRGTSKRRPAATTGGEQLRSAAVQLGFELGARSQALFTPGDSARDGDGI